MSETNGSNRIGNLAEGAAGKSRVTIVKIATPGQREAMAILQANMRDAQLAYMAANTEWGPAGSRYHADGYWFTVDQ